MKKRIAILLAAVLTLSFAITGCGDDDADDLAQTPEYSEEDETGGSDADEYEDADEDGDEDDEFYELYNVGTAVEDDAVELFIGQPFYKGTVSDEDEALDLLNKFIKYIGGDESIKLELDIIDTTDEGNTFYTYHQMLGNIKVEGASVKLVTDKDGNPIGLNMTLSLGLDGLGDAEWSVSAEEAEAMVARDMKDNGYDVKVISGATEQTVLTDQEEEGKYHYAWVVYTQNPFEDSDKAYLANYVTSEGEYLYINPVTSPGDTEEQSTAVATFSFDGLEPDTWTGTVTKYHGETETLTVPVAKDPKTGDVYLADTKRQIMCADYLEYEDNDTVKPRKLTNGRFTDNEVILYNTMIEIYDFYESTGWKGADGKGTPILILMDWVDENGDPVHNACYSGKDHGYDVFKFNRDEPDGEAYDVIAHEYTHGLTTSTMISTLYMNDYGAIEESMSDIFGNLVEALLGKTEDKTWLIQENGAEPLRCMSDPHQFDQPEFTWDRYYVPPATTPSVDNDNGGVHRNSSLLNLIAYRLNEAGMDQNDQLYFWRNVALALTPRTDYEMMSLVLPWTLSIVGKDEYMDVLTAAIEETGIADRSIPDSIPEDLSSFRMDFSDIEDYKGYETLAVVSGVDSGGVSPSWPDRETDMIVITVKPGTYYFQIYLENDEKGEKIMLIKSNDGWKSVTYDEPGFDVDDPDCAITVGPGEIMNIEAPDLSEYLSK